MLPVDRIEKFVRNETRQTASVTHDFSHLKRTAIGAKWFVRILNGSKREEQLAYVAGLLHDIVRPPSEKICHAKTSAERAREILDHLGLSRNDIELVVLSIRDHRKKTKWLSPLHQSVFLSDKILEQMGAFIVCRRCVYIGECIEYKNKDFRETVISHFIKKLRKFNPGKFPKRFSRFIKYQYSWPENFLSAFKNREDWATELSNYFYDCGRKKIEMEKAIKVFKPKFGKDREYKKEALEYTSGKKFRQFYEMIK
jgi:HD superfamily phosphohydrolase YqeK